MLNKISVYIRSRKLILFVTLAYTIVVLTVLLNRFWQYEAFYYDHGMMEATAYQVSQFQMPLHDREYGKVSIFVDHLYPSLQVVLAPFYWISNSYETPIIVMSLLTGLSVLVGYELAKKLIKNELMIYALLFAYMFYIGMQNALIFMVHDITIEIPFLMLLFWAIVNRKVKLYYLLLLLNLGFKESVSITTLAVGIFIFFYEKSWRKHALVTIVISVFYAWVSTKVIIPYFQWQAFGQWGAFKYAPEISTNPLMMLSKFVDTSLKRETITASLLTFGLLPLFSPLSWILILQDFAQRFVLIESSNPFRQGMNLHYSANLVVILFFSSVLAVSWLQKKWWYRRIIIFHALAIFFVVFVFHRFIFRGPFGLFYNREFYNITSNQKFMNDFVARIPRKGKVMVQNNLAVRFTHDNLYLLLDDKHIRDVDPDVIALDFRPGQNINNYWPNSTEAMVKLSETLLADPKYKVYYSEASRYIFVKK